MAGSKRRFTFLKPRRKSLAAHNSSNPGSTASAAAAASGSSTRRNSSFEPESQFTISRRRASSNINHGGTNGMAHQPCATCGESSCDTTTGQRDHDDDGMVVCATATPIYTNELAQQAVASAKAVPILPSSQHSDANSSSIPMAPATTNIEAAEDQGAWVPPSIFTPPLEDLNGSMALNSSSHHSCHNKHFQSRNHSILNNGSRHNYNRHHNNNNNSSSNNNMQLNYSDHSVDSFANSSHIPRNRVRFSFASNDSANNNNNNNNANITNTNTITNTRASCLPSIFLPPSSSNNNKGDSEDFQLPSIFRPPS